MCFFIVLIICFIFIFYYQVNGDLAQLARASALQAEGQGFKSPNLHKSTFSDEECKRYLKLQEKENESEGLRLSERGSRKA